MSRGYHQTLRAQTTEQTRAKILRAMDRRLRTKRPVPLSVDLIAQDAGVVRSTVYAVFGSRAGLFDAYAQELWARSGLPRLSQAVQSDDPVTHLHQGILEGARMFAANLPVFRRLYAMDALDPDALGGAVRRMEQDRLAGMQYLATRLADAGLLRPDVDANRATDLLWTLCSFQALNQQIVERGLAVDDAAALLSAAAERALCRPNEPDR